MIRRANKKDIPALLKMGRGFHAESPRYKDIPFIWNHAVEFLEMSFQSDTTRVIFIAEEDGEAVGMMGAELQVFALFNHDELFSVDFGFYVVPEKRGSSVAYRLIKAYEEWAGESGVKDENISLAESAGISSNEVHEFLEKMGYTQLGASFRKAG